MVIKDGTVYKYYYLLIHKSSTSHHKLDLQVFFVEMFVYFFFLR